MNSLYFLLWTGSSVLREFLAGSKGWWGESVPWSAIFTSTEWPEWGRDATLIPIVWRQPFQILDVVQADAVPPSPPSWRFLGGGEVGQVGQRREPPLASPSPSRLLGAVAELSTAWKIMYACIQMLSKATLQVIIPKLLQELELTDGILSVWLSVSLSLSHSFLIFFSQNKTCCWVLQCCFDASELKTWFLCIVARESHTGMTNYLPHIQVKYHTHEGIEALTFSARLSFMSSSSTPPSSSSSQKPNPERLKKCKAVFGQNQKELWCNKCRWKKKCIRWES